MASTSATNDRGDPSERPSTSHARPPREMFIQVEVFVNNVNNNRKLSRKKTDKRESTRPMSGPSEVSLKKVKEKTSWLSLPKTETKPQVWRSATCKLISEDSTFIVYVEGSQLLTSIALGQLFCYDIRHVHRSLLDRKHCLGIFDISKQNLNVSSDLPYGTVYLHFPDAELMDAWMLLLRSHARPETYGEDINRSEGGFYRMWRQITLTCESGRNLGNVLNSPWTASTNHGDHRFDGDIEMDNVYAEFYCEIFVNGMLSGRTTTQVSQPPSDRHDRGPLTLWAEQFLLEDLPPFGNLEVVVRQKKSAKEAAIVGSVVIPLICFPRGELLEGSYPVLTPEELAGLHCGLLNLKLRVDEEIILPYRMYENMLQTIKSRNYLLWLSDIQTAFQAKPALVSASFAAVALHENYLISNISDIIDRETRVPPSTGNPLFRGNSPASTSVRDFLHLYGDPFLEASLGPVLQRIHDEREDKITFDWDSFDPKVVNKNYESLLYWVDQMWASIYGARFHCPIEIRSVLRKVRESVEARQPRGPDGNHNYFNWQITATFIFLRWICPGLLNPHLYGLLPGIPEPRVSNLAKHIGRALMYAANLNPQSGSFKGTCIQQWAERNMDNMINYLVVVSTDAQLTQNPPSADKEIKDKAVKARAVLNARTHNLPTLRRESIPLLPHLFDIPKDLAIISSFFVRHARKLGWPRTRTNMTPFDELCHRCTRLEELALSRVSRCAPRSRGIDKSIAPSPGSPSFPPEIPPLPPSVLPQVPTSPTSPRQRLTSLTSSGAARRSRKTSRPVTAPSRSPSTGPRSHSQDGYYDRDGYIPAVPSSPIATGSTTTLTTSISGGGNVTRVYSRTSRTSFSSKHSVQPIPISHADTDEVADGMATAMAMCLPMSLPSPSLPPHLPSNRVTYPHHPRSTSTDSALLRKNIPAIHTPTSPTLSAALDDPPLSPDGTDEPGKKKKGLFRILRM